MNRDDLAARLASHQPVINTVTGRAVGCQCMDAVFVTNSSDTYATHLADVALAWFQEHTTEEVAIRHHGTCYPQGSAWARELTERPYGETIETVRRRVTAWEEP